MPPHQGIEVHQLLTLRQRAACSPEPVGAGWHGGARPRCCSPSSHESPGCRREKSLRSSGILLAGSKRCQACLTGIAIWLVDILMPTSTCGVAEVNAYLVLQCRPASPELPLQERKMGLVSIPLMSPRGVASGPRTSPTGG